MTKQCIYDLKGELPRQFLTILQDEPVPIRRRRADVPEELAEIIHRALAREPGKRFKDVAEMRKALVRTSKV